MKLLFGDYEGYYDSAYTLKKLSTSEYVRDDRFLAYGASLAWGVDGVPQFYRWQQLLEYYATLDWSQTTFVAHHCHFDGFITTARAKHIPGRYSCTMSMARALYHGVTGVGLDELARYEQIGSKLPVLAETKGVREPTPELWTKIEALCNNDVWVTQQLYKKYAPQLPESEHDIINTNVRLFAQPRIRVDVELAREGLAETLKHKADLIAATGLTKEQISKDGLFVEQLQKFTPCPMKWSTTQEKAIPALASTDDAFQALLVHENEAVRKLAAARKAVSSTTDEAKAKGLIIRGTTGDGLLPIYNNFSGAHTHRDSGGDSFNAQNFRRKSKLRRALKAPEDHVLCVGDASQIECRTLADLADDFELLDQFRKKLDPYAIQATDIFGFTVNKHDHVDERFIGKTAVLGLGFQMGAERFQRTVAVDSQKYLGKTILLPIEQAARVVNTYRQRRRPIVALWGKADDWLRFMTFADKGQITYKHITIDAETKRVYLPNGMYLSYPKLRCINAQYEFWNGHYFERIFPGKLIENIVQALARIVTFTQLQVIDKVYPLVMKTHDEGVWLALKEKAQEALDWGLAQLRVPPVWSPNMPLDAEGGYDECYSK